MSKHKKTQTLPYKMKRIHSEREEATKEAVKRVCYHDVRNALAYLEGPILYAGRVYGCLTLGRRPYPKVTMESGQELTVNVAWWKDEPDEQLVLELIAVAIHEPESRMELARTTLPRLFSKVTPILGTYHPERGLKLEKDIPDCFDEAIQKLLPREKAVSILDEAYKEMTQFAVDRLGDETKKRIVSGLLEFSRPRSK